MGIDVDPSELDPANIPQVVAGAELYRYGGSFYTGEQDGVILRCEEHVSKAAKAKGDTVASSIRIDIGLEGQPGDDGVPVKVRMSEYIGLGRDTFSREKFANMVRTLQPALAKTRGSFEAAQHVGKRVKLLLEGEDEGGEYGMRPRVVRFVAVVGEAAKAAPVAASAAPRPKPAAAPVISDDDIPF